MATQAKVTTRPNFEGASLATLPEPGNRLIQFDMFVIDTSSYAASFTGESVKEEIGVYETKAKVFKEYMKKAVLITRSV